MTKALYLALAAVLIVAAFAFEMEDDDDNEIALMKRIPEVHEYLWAEKRGQNLKKYKSCFKYGQECTCHRRTGNIVYCTGAGNGDGI